MSGSLIKAKGEISITNKTNDFFHEALVILMRRSNQMVTELSMISMIAYFIMKKLKSFIFFIMGITSLTSKMCQLQKNL